MPKRTQDQMTSSRDSSDSLSIDVKPKITSSSSSPPRSNSSDYKPDISSGSSPKKVKGNKTNKTHWSVEEDTILVEIMADWIKSNLWPLIKADGRLVHRTSYGVQYHAKMLLSKGTGKGK